jgi:hypothetical protein
MEAADQGDSDLPTDEATGAAPVEPESCPLLSPRLPGMFPPRMMQSQCVEFRPRCPRAKAQSLRSR